MRLLSGKIIAQPESGCVLRGDPVQRDLQRDLRPSVRSALSTRYYSGVVTVDQRFRSISPALTADEALAAEVWNNRLGKVISDTRSGGYHRLSPYPPKIAVKSVNLNKIGR